MVYIYVPTFEYVGSFTVMVLLSTPLSFEGTVVIVGRGSPLVSGVI